ncbi:polymeric immunoglobulin receptor-like isoform X3 [Perca fluviatilis]|uniref:polymeric immunoglobulin receptor-like isoform X3 n=1 Tax=Perca fluviatilis TaxID=8168 RepID=UPI0019636928|nr:polymeric immunoglobulin receptor-like isoform X3 [Perca fluviatilis]
MLFILLTDSCCDHSTKVQRYEESSVSFSCPYESEYQNSLKYICRGNQPSTCLQHALISSDNKQKGQFTLTDDMESRKFTVTITSLTQNNSGSYLCGVHGNTGLDVFSAFELEVKDFQQTSTVMSTINVVPTFTVVEPVRSQATPIPGKEIKGDGGNMNRNKTKTAETEEVISVSDIYQNQDVVYSKQRTSKPQSACQHHDDAGILSCVRSAAGLIRVSGYEGREVQVSCPYGEGYESYEKYLCKNDCGSDDVLIKTTEAKKNRYSIHDDKQNWVFTVTISDLRFMDAGKYWCGITRTGYDTYPAEVKLEVKQDSCCDHSTKVQRYEESSVSFSCPYESEYQNSLKYICRGNQPSTCLQHALISSDNKQKGQFTLTDDMASRKFTVTITSLTQKNSGSYLCGVHGNTGLDVFSAFELEVKDFQQTSTVMSTINVVPTFTVVEPVRSQATPIPGKEIKDAALFYSVIFIVPAVLLILTFALVIVYKYKGYKVRGAGGNMNRNKTKTAETEEVISVAHIYEIEDVAYSKQRTSKPQSSCQHHDDEQDPVYQNFITTDDIYCNQI